MQVQKNIIYVKKGHIWNPATCSCKNGKYLASIIDDSVITCDEVINAEAKSYDEETNFNEKKHPTKTLSFYIVLASLLITIVSLTAASIYCYLIKYWAKQKHLLLFKGTEATQPKMLGKNSPHFFTVTST